MQVFSQHICNSAKPGRISTRAVLVWNETSDEESGKYDFRLNIICYYLLVLLHHGGLLLTECAGTSDEEDEDVWYVVGK